MKRLFKNTRQNAFKVLPYLTGLFLILFVTSFIPALYFYKGEEVRIVNLVVRSLLIAITPILFLPLIYWISIRKPILKDWKNILLHIFLSILFCFTFLLSFQFLILFILEGENFLGLGFHSITDILTRQFFSVGSILFFSYWGIVVLLGLKKYYEEIEEAHRKSIEMQSQLEEVTLSSLQAQLKPHFLFNTLSMVDQMISENPKKAIDIVEKLQKLLRNTFDQYNSDSCTIRDEIRFLKKYLSIEESRFQDRLDVNYSISGETEDVMIPRYLLQPLVENALIHGVSKTMEKCMILIKSELMDGNLVLSIENDGYQGRNLKKIKNKGIGLKNVEERIDLYFGAEANLKIEFLESGRFISRIQIPQKNLKEIHQ